MLLEHKRYYGLGMEATATVCSWNTNVITAMDGTVTVCSWNTNAIMIWAWMLSSSSALEHERHYGLGMDAAVSVCSWNRKVSQILRESVEIYLFTDSSAARGLMNRRGVGKLRRISGRLP